MAAKQGLTAQIHQYSEDTKRSLLSRAPAGIKSHSWLSNLNTTCTIKSAPPRTPEVMSMLGTKCGWLVKRNEQHVWQKRWCCVVPHTFLYYFEASPMEIKTDGDEDTIHTHEAWSGGGINVAIFANLDQEALNMAVKDEYNGAASGGVSTRMSLYSSLPNIMGGGGHHSANAPAGGGENGEEGGMVAWDPESGGQANAVNSPLSPTGAGSDGDANNKGTYQFVASSNLQPVGIIDLECYSAVNRSKMNPTVLELAGDSVTNPDLRSFYFQSATVEDAESWTKALLSDRHQSLKDETEAYRQVCESFPLQLANCSQMIDAAEAKAEAMEREAYTVRSASEEGRRKVVSAVREMLERKCWETEASKKRKTKDISGKNKMNGMKQSPFGDDPLISGGKSNTSPARGSKGPARGGLEFEETKNEEGNNALLSVVDSQYEKLETNRTAFLRELEAALSSPSAVATSNVVPPVQTLVDYAAAIIGSFGDLRSQLQKYEMDLSTSVQQDQTQLEDLKGAIEGRDAQLADTERKHAMMASDLKSEIDASRNQVEELTKQLEAQRMEFGMYQNATKTKMSELQQHKKILKREVIELRKKIDESGSENTTVAHEYGKIKSSYQSMKDKNSTLERYIDRLEKQVGVQQNMMEMMSHSGASFVGKIVGPGVTQTDSKDAISLSGMSHGMSTGSLYRRGDSGHQEGAKSTSYTPLKPRPLLPPESKSTRHVHDVSPLPAPRFHERGVGGKLGSLKSLIPAVSNEVDFGEDDRDPSTAYRRSETPTTAGGSGGISPGSVDNDIGDVVMAPSASPRTPKRSKSQLSQEPSGESDGSSDPILAKRSGGHQYLSPKTPDDSKSERSFRAAAMSAALTSPDVGANITPIQSNAGEDDVFGDEVKNIPSLDTNAERMLNVNASSSLEEDKNRTVDYLNDQLLSGAAGMSGGDAGGPADLEDDDMDDNASRVSDITEDRTQRQIDDDLAERRKILLAYVNKANGGSSASLSNASTQRRLQTIENMLPTTREDLESNASGRESRGSSRLSVAQRARLNAENRSNSHRSASPGPTPRGGSEPSLRGNNAQQPSTRGDSSITQGSVRSTSTEVSLSETIGRSGSFLKSLGKVIEKAVDSSVLGVSLPADENYDSSSYYDETESEVLSSVVSGASTTLAERIAQQRERQVAFLKNKGLIDDESSMRGGAGASSPNSKAPTPRRTLSTRSTGSSRWSSRVIAQDEV